MTVRLPHCAASLLVTSGPGNNSTELVVSVGAREGDCALRQLSAQEDAANNAPFTLDALPRTHLKLSGASPWLACLVHSKVLVTVDNHNYALRLVSLESGKTLQTVPFHTAPVTALAVTPDGGVVVSGSRDSTACIWRVLSASKHRSGLTGGFCVCAAVQLNGVVVSCCLARPVESWHHATTGGSSVCHAGRPRRAADGSGHQRRRRHCAHVLGRRHRQFVQSGNVRLNHLFFLLFLSGDTLLSHTLTQRRLHAFVWHARAAHL